METAERKISCTVFTPDDLVYKGDIDLAVVPALTGGMGFLYNHAPLIAGLGIGEVRIRKGQDMEYLVVEGGFVEINENELSVFPVNAYRREDLSKEKLEKEIRRLRELKKPVDFTEREKIMNEIQRLKIRLKVASR